METREREQERICFLSQILVAALVVVSRHLAATAAHRYLWTHDSTPAFGFVVEF